MWFIQRIKLLGQVMKVFERVIERKMRNLVSLDDMHVWI